jgi:PKD repeat protein
MKKIYFILTLILLLSTSFLSVAQTVVLYGYVKGTGSGLGIPNHQVIIESQVDTATSTGMNYYSSVFTSTNGLFVDSLSVPFGQNVKFRISTLDCQSNGVVDTFEVLNPKVIQLPICDSGFALCQADFLTYPDTNNHRKVFFVNTSIPGNANFVWNFGDGNTSTQKNPVHTYLHDSTYLVSLTVTDTLTGCFSQRTDSIQVSPVFYCSNSFTHSSNFLVASFSGSVNNSMPTLFKWDFGDFSSAAGQNPQHTYSNAGIYKVTLQSISVNPQNFDTCISHSSQHIIIQAPPSGNIWGQVFADTNKVKLAEVVLYHYKDTTSGFIPFDSVDVSVIDSLNLCYYYFGNVPFGKYLTKARLSNKSQLYDLYGPAYHGNTYQWDQAEPFILNQGGINKPIHFTDVYSLNGNVRIEGQVLEGTHKNPGDPIPNVLLYLYDVQGDVYGYTYTDINGFYAFDDLNYRKYFIHADIINKENIPAWVWPNEGNTVQTGINIYVGKDKVTSLAESNPIRLKIYPNPVKDVLYIAIDLQQASTVRIDFVNMLGANVLSHQRTLGIGTNNLQFILSDFVPGVYFMSITNAEGDIYRSKLVVH